MSHNIPHFLIFERYTEEEFIVTLSKLLINSGFKVSLLISEKINNLINFEIQQLKYESVKVFNNTATTKELLKLINNEKYDLIFVPSSISNSIFEIFQVISFLKKNPVCHLIAKYEIWLNSFPPFIFDKRKVIRIHKILDWLYCHLIRKYIKCFFITEIEINSNNPLKELIYKKTKKQVFEFPFKVGDKPYNPDLNYDFPIFVVPGSIDKDRRDYKTLIEIFNSKEFENKKWKLILLGRPVGHYGNKILEHANNINKKLNEERILTFNYYIEREIFEYYMNISTHIIANVKPSGYKKGKDSGAIYDIFKYNKIGIFHEDYFYDKDSNAKKVILTYKNNDELKNIIFSIVSKKEKYNQIIQNINEISHRYTMENYVKYLLEQRIDKI